MPIVLLDVDDTVAISNKFYGQHDGGYRYNIPLLKALKARGLTTIILFTAYVLRGVAKSLDDEVIAAPSRLKLINYLKKNGFTVLKAITTLDVVYAKGCGRYYQEIIMPYESRVLEGENLLTGTSAGSYRHLCEQELELRARADKGLLGDKGALYEYFVKEMNEVSQAQLPTGIIVIDDREAILEAISTRHHELQCVHPLQPICAKPHMSYEDYIHQLDDKSLSGLDKKARCSVM